MEGKSCRDLLRRHTTLVVIVDLQFAGKESKSHAGSQETPDTQRKYDSMAPVFAVSTFSRPAVLSVRQTIAGHPT